MRVQTVSKLVMLGIGIHLGQRAAARWLGPLALRVRDPGEPSVQPEDFAADPADPVQGLDEAFDLLGEPLDVDALSNEDAQSALDVARDASEREGSPEFEDSRDAELAAGATASDSGELYGSHTPRAVDNHVVDDDHAMQRGETWLEALGTSAIEGGAEPERELDMFDDQELDASRPTDTRDIPVADRGSAGPRGL